MPYGMPNLSDKEYGTIVRWLAEGAPPPAGADAIRRRCRHRSREWEKFLNGQSLREQLMSRYLYEHLFIGHLHLADTL